MGIHYLFAADMEDLFSGLCQEVGNHSQVDVHVGEQHGPAVLCRVPTQLPSVYF